MDNFFEVFSADCIPVGFDEQAGIVITWNRSITFRIWFKTFTTATGFSSWLLEERNVFTVCDTPSLDDAIKIAEKKMAEFRGEDT